MSLRSRSESRPGSEKESSSSIAKQDDVENTQNKEKFQLKRSIGLLGCIAYLGGSIVGSGIFVSPVGVLYGTNGSVGMSLVLWAACGIVACLVALCYIELGAAIQESGAEYTYLLITYPAVVAFTFVWSVALLAYNTNTAATAVTFGSYLAAPFYVGDCNPPDTVVKLAAIVVILLLNSIAYVNQKVTTKIQVVLAAAKFIGMAIIIVGGLVQLGLGNEVGLDNLSYAFRPEDLAGLGFSQIGLACYQGLWSYSGYTSLNYVVEEIKDAKRTLPLAVLITMPLVTIFYLLVNISYFSVLTPEDILESNAVAVTWAYKVLGSAGWILSVVVCLSTTGSMNGSFVFGSRLPFAAARRGHFPQIFGMVNVDFYTPGPAMFIRCFLPIVFLIPNNFYTLVNASSFITWVAHGLVVAGVFVLRYTHPNLPRPFKVPLLIPGIVVIIAVYLVIAPLVDDADILILYAAGFLCCGPIVYFIFIYKKLRIPGFDRLTLILQQTLNVAPPDWEAFN